MKLSTYLLSKKMLSIMSILRMKADNYIKMVFISRLEYFNSNIAKCSLNEWSCPFLTYPILASLLVCMNMLRASPERRFLSLVKRSGPNSFGPRPGT